MEGAKKRSLTCFLLLILLSIATESNGEQITPITNTTSLYVSSEDAATSISSIIYNTIPNAMIWSSITVTNISGAIPENPLHFGADLYYFDQNDEDYYMLFNVLSNNGTESSYRFAYSTCPNQYSVALQEDLDIGDKVGTWNWTFANKKPTFNYNVSITVGAQSGDLAINTNYTIESIPVPVLYFNLDLASINAAPNYLLTVNLFSLLPTGLSWVKGVVARSNECPVFSYDFELVNNENQDYMMATTSGNQLTFTFPSLPGELTYLAVQMTKDAVNNGLVISWSASPAQTYYDNTGSDESTTQWTTLAIVLAVITAFLVIAVIALAAVIGFMGVKYVKPHYQSI